MVTSRRERAQLLLIGGITLAFIILGIVVVFNGVLYTETLSSGPTGQSGSDATVTELEVEQGVACVLARGGSDITENITAFNDAYRSATAQSTPAAININDVTVNDNADPTNATITITYNSNSHNYIQNRTILASDCLTGDS